MEEKHIIPPVNEGEAQNRPGPLAPESAADATDEKTGINRRLDDGNFTRQLIAPGFTSKAGYQTSCHCGILRGMGRGLPPTRGRG